MMDLKAELADCQHNAVILSDLARGIDLMIGEGADYEGTKVALAGVVWERANALAAQLDRLEQKMERGPRYEK